MHILVKPSSNSDDWFFEFCYARTVVPVETIYSSKRAAIRAASKLLGNIFVGIPIYVKYIANDDDTVTLTWN